MTAAEKMHSIKLEENDVPGAKFHCSEVSEHSVCELKRWLECRGLPASGKKKPELVKMCLDCMQSKNTDIVIHVDGGKWYEQKVSAVLSSVRTSKSTEAVPFLPTSQWNNFPSINIPKGFCYGTIYEHIISTAKVHTYQSADSESEDNLTDFNTSKPMLKGRQYFTNNYKDDHYFLKASVMASYTQQVVYHVSVTMATPSGKVRDASCDCKASSMGRCSHISSLLFALEDYTLNFGYKPCASTSKLCTWNVGKKSKRQQQPCHSTSHSKKIKADKFRSYDPLGNIEINETKFVNNFIATLPNSGSDSMFSQILEREYPDYEVEMEVLKDRTKSALQLIQFEKKHSTL
ncbi:hypothetical protein ACJMK2_003861 [Sinanodonta woodiana]|uniref:SWIM-type domain-containing protein n=1 Tax=Sinanodonta woodiana TaxID=1069815 RepID=A0ABD3XZH0_SINWO